jgi:hypothetical protein
MAKLSDVKNFVGSEVSTRYSYNALRKSRYASSSATLVETNYSMS